MGVNRIEEFAARIGTAGEVWVRGAGSRVEPPGNLRTVEAPTGISSFEPDEMTVTCAAGTRLSDLDDVLAERGQYVNLGQLRHPHGTVGGALATGWNDHLRLGRGPVRDSLLEVHVVTGRGDVVKGGGRTVKNVSGFDLCRLMVGSHGRLGAIAEVTLRTRPLPRATRWLSVDDVDGSRITDLFAHLYRPSAVLWNGLVGWVCLEGHPSDIETARAELRDHGFPSQESMSGPDLDALPYRWSIAPRAVVPHVEGRSGQVIAEVGVGVVHGDEVPPRRNTDAAIEAIHRRLTDSFDPEHRLNPGAGDHLIR